MINYIGMSSCYMIEQNHLSKKEDESPVKVIRELLGLSQQEFATRLGVSITTISRWERGKTPPTFTIGQIRILLKELEPFGLNFDNLPDDMTPGNHFRTGTENSDDRP
jgi:transcriptional regulator with XRE-family HTH domain